MIQATQHSPDRPILLPCGLDAPGARRAFGEVSASRAQIGLAQLSA
jgi:hypothetical protein